MSSQAEDAFNEDTEVVARMLYARNRTPREPGWLDQDESIREQAIKDVRVVVRLYIDATWAEMPLDERCARAANEAQQAFLAADREAPNEPKETTT